jgi:hypothetical protein
MTGWCTRKVYLTIALLDETYPLSRVCRQVWHKACRRELACARNVFAFTGEYVLALLSKMWFSCKELVDLCSTRGCAVWVNEFYARCTRGVCISQGVMLIRLPGGCSRLSIRQLNHWVLRTLWTDNWRCMLGIRDQKTKNLFFELTG